MEKRKLVELKAIADGLAALGKPPDTNVAQARARLALMERFECLITSVTQADRHAIVVTLRDMLAGR